MEEKNAYIAFKETEVYKKAKRVAALDETRDHVFGRGRNGKYAFVYQKRYMLRFKFKFGSRIREHWQRMKDLNGYLLYFPLDKTCGATS